jgi:hypothetical protein
MFEGGQAKNGPAKWIFTTEGLKGHDMAIAHTTKIESEKFLATALIMKFKMFCDFKTHFSIRIKDNGRGGIVWRWRDNFNYYFMEMYAEGIIIGKFVHGKKFELYTHHENYVTD